MSLIFLIVAIVLFILAGVIGGISASAGDLIAFGLAAFAIAHLPLGDYINRVR